MLTKQINIDCVRARAEERKRVEKRESWSIISCMSTSCIDDCLTSPAHRANKVSDKVNWNVCPFSNKGSAEPVKWFRWI